MRNLDFGVMREAPPISRLRRRSSFAGAIAGILGIVFGMLGIFTVGLIFVPLAGLCSLIGLVRALGGLSGPGFGLSILGAILTAVGAVVSPSVWAIIGTMFVVGSLRGEPNAQPAPRPAATTNAVYRPVQASGPVTATQVPARSLSKEVPAEPAPVLPGRSLFAEIPSEVVRPAQAPGLTPSPQVQPSGPKRDIRGFMPGQASREVLDIATRAGWTCRKTETLDYIDCKNGVPSSSDIKFEEIEFYARAGYVTSVIFRFNSGNDFRSLTGVISAQYAAAPYDYREGYSVDWRFAEGFRLEFRKISDAATLTLTHPEIGEMLRARQKEAERQRNPAPRF